MRAPELAAVLAMAQVMGGNPSAPYGMRFRPGAPAKKKPDDVQRRRAKAKAARASRKAQRRRAR